MRVRQDLSLHTPAGRVGLAGVRGGHPELERGAASAPRLGAALLHPETAMLTGRCDVDQPIAGDAHRDTTGRVLPGMVLRLTWRDYLPESRSASDMVLTVTAVDDDDSFAMDGVWVRVQGADEHGRPFDGWVRRAVATERRQP